MTAHSDTVLTWSRGLARLSPGVVPCRGLRDADWRDAHGRFYAFIDQRGVRTHQAGCGMVASFGAHTPIRPITTAPRSFPKRRALAMIIWTINPESMTSSTEKSRMLPTGGMSA
ncbi:hypothetical protein mvi_49980 [Methylobacterium indicum]|uniref:Uncharacterized protein n=1 Tax=Methylobacterium indicum TaxID=1775910 RepID=A0A8H9C7S1_9HYPH|nr:hypothetical protein mvi_49980 [Methylobacterium indicum]